MMTAAGMLLSILTIHSDIIEGPLQYAVNIFVDRGCIFDFNPLQLPVFKNQ